MQKNKRVTIFIIALAILCATVLTVYAVNYVMKQTKAEDTFQPAKVSCIVFTPKNAPNPFTYQVQNGNNTDDDPTNDSNIPVYIRVAVTANWVSKDDPFTILGETPQFTVKADSTKWYLHSDGYYYYIGEVAAGDATEESISVTDYVGKVGSEYRFDVKVIAEAIQITPGAENGVDKIAAGEAWGIYFDGAWKPYKSPSN